MRGFIRRENGVVYYVHHRAGWTGIATINWIGLGSAGLPTFKRFQLPARELYERLLTRDERIEDIIKA